MKIERFHWKTIYENAFHMVFFGLLSYLFGMVQFTMPGIDGGVSNLAEIPLLIALFHLKNPFTIIGMCLISSLATPAEGSYASTLIMHVLALMVSWLVYKWLNKYCKKSITLSVIWFFYVFVYYLFLLLPLMIITNYLFALNLEKKFFGFFSELAWSVHLELISSSIISALYLLQHKLRRTLNDYKDNLEITVEKRTKELSQTIEELKKTQNILVHSEKMVSLGTLTAGVAHEINNPLNFISGGLAMVSKFENELKPDSSDDLRKRFRDSIQIIMSGLNRATDIVKALMTFSYRGTPVLVETDINQIIDSTILFLNYDIPKEISVIKEYQMKKPVPVFAEKIHQVLINIFENAIFELKSDHSKNKILTVKTELINETAVITISNTGKTIPDEIIHQIFDPFYTTKDPGQGTGLGLSICYSLIQEHNGKIYAQNNENGVSFIIELPLN
jgi:signal transduction histidine kinase